MIRLTVHANFEGHTQYMFAGAVAGTSKLVELGFKSAGQVRELIGKALLATAGIQAEPTNKAALAKARTLLQKQMETERELRPFLSRALHHPDLARLHKVRALLAAPSEAHLRIRLIERNGFALEASSWPEEMQVVDLSKPGSSKSARFSDLLRLGIDSYAAFDRLVEQAMSDLADEDYAFPKQ